MLKSFQMKTIPGILLCLAIAAPSWFLGKLFPVAGGPVVAIAVGIIVAAAASCHKPPRINVDAGIAFTSKKLLQYAVILLGFEMDLFHVARVGGQSLYVMLFTLAAAFATAWGVGKMLKIAGNTTTLIGVGTAICGGSAIAATAPVLRAKDEEVARAISTIFLFNIAAVFIFPALGRAMNLDDADFGMWAGTAINDTSSVVAAGTAWSNAAGNDNALAFATIVKLTRTLAIVPITLFLAVRMSRNQARAAASGFHFAKVFPWFVLFFAGAAVLNTFAGLPNEFSGGLVVCGKFFINMAMAAIGLKTNLKSLVSNGYKPILLGLCCWFAVTAVSLVVQFFTPAS